MKAAKNLLIVCFVIFLNFATVSGVFGQADENSAQKQKAEQIEKQKISQSEKAIKADSENREITDMPKETQNATGKSGNERYRIGFQDTLEIQVFRHPELSQIVNVNTDGTIYLPRIEKPIVAVCKTERELADVVTLNYKSYLRTPFVNVRAVEQKSQPFAVIGAVEKPGSFYLNRRIRLLELLSFAGGHDVEKAGAKIQIARVGNVSACSENTESNEETTDVVFFSLDLKDVVEGKENPWMQPGDIVSVLEAEEAYVVGNVYKPAKISLKEPVTLTQAIAIAGGLEATAKTDKVVIQRQERGNVAKVELVYNLKDIRDKKIPDPKLQANDIIEVSTDKVKTIRNGLIKAITGGLGNIFYRFP